MISRGGNVKQASFLPTKKSAQPGRPSGVPIQFVAVCAAPWISTSGKAWRASLAPFLEAARCQRDIGSAAHVSSPDALGNPVVGCIRAVTDQYHAHVRHARRADWS